MIAIKKQGETWDTLEYVIEALFILVSTINLFKLKYDYYT